MGKNGGDHRYSLLLSLSILEYTLYVTQSLWSFVLIEFMMCAYMCHSVFYIWPFRVDQRTLTTWEACRQVWLLYHGHLYRNKMTSKEQLDLLDTHEGAGHWDKRGVQVFLRTGRMRMARRQVCLTVPSFHFRPCSSLGSFTHKYFLAHLR